MQTIYADSWSDFSRDLFHIDLCVMKLRWARPIFHGPVFFFLKDYLMDEDHTRVTVTFDLKINVGYDDLYLTVQWFCFIFWRVFDDETNTLG